MTQKKESTAPDVVLDLDAEQRDEDEVKEPFTFKYGGRSMTMIDPEEIDWLDLVDLKSPTEILSYALTSEDRTFLFGQSMPGWKMGKLVKAYMNHYGLEDRMRQQQREQRAAGLHSV